MSDGRLPGDDRPGARHGFDLMLAIIGRPPARFAPFSGLFQQALDRLGQLDLKFGMPDLSQQALMTNVELYGNRGDPTCP